MFCYYTFIFTKFFYFCSTCGWIKERMFFNQSIPSESTLYKCICLQKKNEEKDPKKSIVLFPHIQSKMFSCKIRSEWIQSVFSRHQCVQYESHPELAKWGENSFWFCFERKIEWIDGNVRLTAIRWIVQKCYCRKASKANAPFHKASTQIKTGVFSRRFVLRYKTLRMRVFSSEYWIDKNNYGNFWNKCYSKVHFLYVSHGIAVLNMFSHPFCTLGW